MHIVKIRKESWIGYGFGYGSLMPRPVESSVGLKTIHFNEYDGIDYESFMQLDYGRYPNFIRVAVHEDSKS